MDSRSCSLSCSRNDKKSSQIRVCRSLWKGTRYPDIKNSSLKIQDERHPELGVWCNDSKLFTLEGTRRGTMWIGTLGSHPVTRIAPIYLGMHL
ncbi:hypothetical protein BDZ89DRAFT_524552 [Hymenopellis radicata]|nr:hypothetical protein BDZ89DRAFT_524552 [Hymenopellis radicata]